METPTQAWYEEDIAGTRTGTDNLHNCIRLAARDCCTCIMLAKRLCPANRHFYRHLQGRASHKAETSCLDLNHESRLRQPDSQCVVCQVSLGSGSQFSSGSAFPARCLISREGGWWYARWMPVNFTSNPDRVCFILNDLGINVFKTVSRLVKSFSIV